MSRLSVYLNAARRMSPGLLAAKVARKAGFRIGFVAEAELLNDPKAKNPVRLMELFDQLSENALAVDGRPVTLKGRSVLEIGAGPLGGVGPTASVDGAVRHLAIDPGLQPGILNSSKVEENYLVPALQAISTRRGVPGDQAALLNGYRDIARYLSGGLAELTAGDARYDTVISVSCLEHIHALETGLTALSACLTGDARQVHLVNFSNHTDKQRPFDEMYETKPEEYSARYGGHINLMRPSDILAAFEAAGFLARFEPLDVREDALPEAIASWWTERYGRDELAVRTGLLMVN